MHRWGSSLDPCAVVPLLANPRWSQTLHERERSKGGGARFAQKATAPSGGVAAELLEPHVPATLRRHHVLLALQLAQPAPRRLRGAGGAVPAQAAVPRVLGQAVLSLEGPVGAAAAGFSNTGGAEAAAGAGVEGGEATPFRAGVTLHGVAAGVLEGCVEVLWGAECTECGEGGTGAPGSQGRAEVEPPFDVAAFMGHAPPVKGRKGKRISISLEQDGGGKAHGGCCSVQ